MKQQSGSRGDGNPISLFDFASVSSEPGNIADTTDKADINATSVFHIDDEAQGEDSEKLNVQFERRQFHLRLKKLLLTPNQTRRSRTPVCLIPFQCSVDGLHRLL